MNNSNKLDVSVSLDRAGSVKKIENSYAKLGIILPEDQLEKDKVIQKFAGDVLENLAETVLDRQFDYHLNEKIASWEILRDIRVMGDQLREKDCTILNPTPKWKEGNRETMFVKYYNDSRSVPEFAALVEMKHRENTFNLVCFPLLNDAFPIEVMRELDISAKEAEQYAFTVCQLERLMKTRIYKHASPDDLPYAPKCIFFVKWFNEEIRIAISREHCDNKKSWSYTTHPLQYDYAEKDRARILPKGSKLLLPFPKVKENDENDILY